MGDPVQVTVNSQKVLILPRDGKSVSRQECEAIKTGVKEAHTRLTCAVQLTTLILNSLGEKEFGTVDAGNFLVAERRVLGDFYDIVLACFRLGQPWDRHGFEDYRRLMRHVLKLLQTIASGLQKNGLIISDVAEKYTVSDVDGSEKNGVAGYIAPSMLQYLNMAIGSDFRRFWEEGDLNGPIHLNFSRLVAEPWDLAQTLIHEATHKFARTWDHAYYGGQLGKPQPTGLTSTRRMFSGLLGNKTEREREDTIEENHEKAISRIPKMGTRISVGEMTPVQALNNADSYGFYVMWLSE